MRNVGKVLGALVLTTSLTWSGSAFAFHGGFGGFHGGGFHGGFHGFHGGFVNPGFHSSGVVRPGFHQFGLFHHHGFRRFAVLPGYGYWDYGSCDPYYDPYRCSYPYGSYY